ncbi:MAG: alanine--glyoxylate aminotransferase family protein [Anaerolineaceae bacterium]|nr:alanine--glyoxylate aminotransferase family protein [Anaerolineaceae bacterium]
MKKYPIPMVPGPVNVPSAIFAAYQFDYGSADLEPEFLDLYNKTEELLQKLLETKNRVAIQTGEGMIALWGALKSCIAPGDRVLALSTGLFGSGIGEMAASIGADVKTLSYGYDQTLSNYEEIEAAIVEFKPKMITAVHCETPSGTLNPLDRLGALKKQHGVPLLYVDAVSSIGGTPVLTDEWGIDLLLGGSQKCLSAPPSISFVAMSEKAQQIVDTINYQGYDALKPFLTAQKDFYFPYTPHWQGVAALSTAVQLILDEGVEACFQRHAGIADYCRKSVTTMGYQLFPGENAIPSPTLTAVCVPDGIKWAELDRRFRQKGLATGGNYGALAEKVFRIGHMGSQADMKLLDQALDVLEKVFKSI